MTSDPAYSLTACVYSFSSFLSFSFAQVGKYSVKISKKQFDAAQQLEDTLCEFSDEIDEATKLVQSKQKRLF